MADEYIRREDAITAACKGFCHPGVRCPDEPCREQTKYLRELPPADVVQVVHGRWIEDEGEGYHGIHCSRCKFSIPYGNVMMGYNFCPNCGAKMDAQREE